MGNFFRDASAPAKMTVVCVVGALIGIGLCSLGHMNFEGPSDNTFVAGALFFWFSLLGLIVGLVWMLLRKVRGGGR